MLVVLSRVCILQADLVEGCAHQMRGTLKMKSFADRVVPTAGIDKLVVGYEIVGDGYVCRFST